VDLNSIWFVLIAVLFTGFFVLEGFDYGVGILLPFLGKDDLQRRVIINTIGPHWDGNEVWMITAGGAMFAAFPNWYATLFSGLYVALVVMLAALIFRGVAFEFRSKDARPGWRKFWDACIFVGSAVPALLWGVAMANLLNGIPIAANMDYVGSFWDLLTPYTLIAGLASLFIFTLHGAIFLSLKTTGELLESAFAVARRLWPVCIVLGFLAVGIGYFVTDMFARLGVIPGIIPLTAGAAMLAAGYFIRKQRGGLAFLLTSMCIAFSTLSLFMGLYPRVMVSSLNPLWSLTVYNASSSDYTLGIMTVVALVFVPVVLVYQGWSYYVLRERLSRESALEY
jgi:cytochrome d ubiquinol oxidase subunit II